MPHKLLRVDGSVIWAHVPEPLDEGNDPYNNTARKLWRDDTIEFSVPDTIEVITLCSDE